MSNITYLAKRMQYVLRYKANQQARETGFMKRERLLTGSSFVVGLVSAWQGNPSVSLAGMSQAIGNAGTPISRQGLNERFTLEAVELMKAMLDESLNVMVKGIAKPPGILARFTGVVLTDSTSVTLPNELGDTWRGSGGYGDNASLAAVKISVRWDIDAGQLQVVELSDGIQHDRNTQAHQAEVAAGSLHLRDLGYFKVDDFEKIEQQGAYWLTKYKIGTHLVDAEGQTMTLSTCLPQDEGVYLDTPVFLGQAKRLPCRLVAERVPLEVVQQRHERIRETARQNQTTPSQRALELAQWTLYLTNVTENKLAAYEVFIMGGYRWQIELLFKLWKSDLRLDEWNTRNPYRILCELYAKLLAAIVTQWFLIIGSWHNPRRSLSQAMPTIHGLAWQWANSLGSLHLLKHTLRALVRSLSRCQMDKSKIHPRYFQLFEVVHA